MKYKKDNKLPNTKNVRRKTNPAGVTTIIEPKNKVPGPGSTPSNTANSNQTNSNPGNNQDSSSENNGGSGLNSSPSSQYPGSGHLPQLPAGSLKQEPGQYGLTSL